MTRRRRRRWLGLALFLLAAAILLPPVVTLNRFHSRLQATLSQALGRQVTFREEVGIRLLPQPAFILENFVVSDDPAFGPEPMLRAESVTARLRLNSLWRGRLEIARLTFDYPSWNLVRDASGRWNLESLLQRTSQAITAPTAAGLQFAPRFPYIETENGRINIKLGAEKLAHGLIETDIALWQSSADAWNLRLEGAPVRTDGYMTDTGTLRLEGSFTRSHGEPLEKTPFDYRLEWEHGQLGQLTALLTGRDRGWRGDVALYARVSGTLDRMRVTSRISVRDFRRYDIASSQSLDLAAECAANFSKSGGPIDPDTSAPLLLSGLDCRSDARGGQLALRGAWSLAPAGPFRFDLFASALPADLLADLFRHAKLGVPDDLTAAGELDAALQIGRAGPERRLQARGQGRLRRLRITSPSQAADFPIGDVAFAFTPPARRRAAGKPDPLPHLDFTPFPLALGGNRPVTVSAAVGPEAAVIRLKGPAGISPLLVAAKTFGLATRDYAAQGSAVLDLAVVAPFTGFASPRLEGSARLASLRLQPEGMPAPLIVRTADLQLDADHMAVERLSGQIAGTRTRFDGRLAIPYHCPSGPCLDGFDLHLSEVDLDDWNRLFHPAYRRRDWLALPRRLIGEKDMDESLLFRIRARGRLSVARLAIKSLLLTDVSTGAEWEDGRLRFSGLRAGALGGRHQGDWIADFSGDRPVYTASGALEGAQAAAVAALWKEDWGVGQIRGRYRVSLSGADAPALRDSLEGDLDFEWKNGAIRRLVWEGSPLVFDSWTAGARIAAGRLAITAGELRLRGRLLTSEGAITFDRALDLRFFDRKSGLALTGSLAAPALAPAPLPPLQAQSAVRTSR
jgi:hypothetical protein